MTGTTIWILGATGRTGRAIAARLVSQGLPIVLVARSGENLARLSASLGQQTSTKALSTLSEIAAAIRLEGPGVVVNTVGPFTQTALQIARACPAGTHYVDLSNELPSALETLALDVEARRKGSVLVTGAGFGVLATESVVLTLCKAHPEASSVRCAAIPAVQNEPGRVGEALAASIAGAFASGGCRYENGALTNAPLFGDCRLVSLPDGREIATASGPTAELEAAHRASGAASVISATSMVPSSAVLRWTLPALSAVMKVDLVRRFVTRRIAAVVLKPAKVAKPQVSWSHVRVGWPSGESQQGWLRTGDAMAFTAAVAAEVSARLARGEGAPGAYTPGALFGSELAESCGGEIIVGAASLSLRRAD